VPRELSLLARDLSGHSSGKAVVIEIADTLEVSIDYLVGKTKVELDNKLLKKYRTFKNSPPKIKIKPTSLLSWMRSCNHTKEKKCSLNKKKKPLCEQRLCIFYL
jgi:hypothetical protein